MTKKATVTNKTGNDGKLSVSPAQIEGFIATVDLGVRKPEATESVDGNDAVRYNHACDYPENSDYGLVLEELRPRGLIGKHILEIGPGPGNLCLELRKAGAAHVVGADPSAEMIRYLREKFSGDISTGSMDFVQESVCKLPDRFGSSFDIVVCQNTFHQLYNPLPALEGMVRATKSGGEVHIFDFRRDIPMKLLANRIAYTKPEIWRDLANSVCAALTTDEFKDLLEQIPGIEFSVVNATNPFTLSNRARELIKLDPIPHNLDYLISQKVVIYKR